MDGQAERKGGDDQTDLEGFSVVLGLQGSEVKGHLFGGHVVVEQQDGLALLVGPTDGRLRRQVVPHRRPHLVLCNTQHTRRGGGRNTT